jgi:hypothetical protein
MKPQEAAAIAAVVWRLVQSFVSAQPFRKTARIIQITNLRLFMRLASSTNAKIFEPRLYHFQRMIESGKPPISPSFFLRRKDRGSYLTVLKNLVVKYSSAFLPFTPWLL